MIQIAVIIVAVMALVMGVTTLVKGEVSLSQKTKLQGGSAIVAGILTMVVGWP